MVTLNAEDIYTDNIDPNATVNPTKVGCVWCNYNTGTVFMCKDNTMNRNVWVRCNPDVLKTLSYLKTITIREPPIIGYGNYTEKDTKFPEYNVDFNVENDYDWICPPTVYAIFRYGKYIVIPTKVTYTLYDHSVSADNCFFNRYGCLNYYEQYGSESLFKVPGTRATMDRYRFPTMNGGKDSIPIDGFNMCRYPGNIHSNRYSALPATGPTSDIMSKIILKHVTKEYFQRMTKFVVVMSPVTNQSQNNDDLRYGIDFSGLRTTGTNRLPEYNLVEVVPNNRYSSPVIYTDSWVVKDNGWTYFFGDTDRNARSGGNCTYICIRAYP